MDNTDSAGENNAGEHDGRTPLPGSERTPAPLAVPAQPPADSGEVEATLVLRRKAPVPESALSERLSPAEFADRYGADPEDASRVEEAARAFGARVVATDLASRRIRIAAAPDALAAAFGTSLTWVSSTDHTGTAITHRQRTGTLHVPAAMADCVTAVLGLDDRPQARANLRIAMPSAVTTSYTPPQLGEVYAFPAGTDGTGETVAIIELGGGFAASDLDEYFGSFGIATPAVTAVGVDGAANVPGGDPNGADGEVLLDIEVAGALAPGANLVVYFAPNTDAGFLDAVATAAHASPTPAAISISWGQSEDSWTAQARSALDQAFVDAAALGAVVTVAAGDDGSTDRVTGGGAHVDFPASSPHALACGGTQLLADPATGVVTSETVWNNGPGRGATGGGISDAFPLPTWQADAGVPAGAAGGGRGVPDVAANADPQTGYRVRVDGTDLVIGGTSAVAPLWAALIARIVQSTGRPLGLAQPALYGAISPGTTPPGFRDVTQGDNGAFTAGPGWDGCTGLGVPIGTALLAALRQAQRP